MSSSSAHGPANGSASDAARDCQIELGGEQLVLLPERAIYWRAQSVLIVSDLHIGKAAAFRAAGVPVPELTTVAMLDRLTKAVARTSAATILCLGDLLHAPTGRTPVALEAVSTWRARHHQLQFVLVRGNHDTRSGDPPDDWDIRCVDEPWSLGPFAWRHRPAITPGRYTFAGHVHPAVSLNGRGRQQITLPCFHFGAQLGLLPAFGEFTGSAQVRPVTGDRVFVVVGERVVQV
jgi:DNA ligase-associated metallophosphoesterase